MLLHPYSSDSLIVFVVLSLVLFLIKVTQKEKKVFRKSVIRGLKKGKSFCDELLENRRLKPLYDKLCEKIKLMSNVCSAAKFEMRAGDGLHSIFNQHVHTTKFPSISHGKKVPIGTEVIFKCLLNWGILSCDVSLINEFETGSKTTHQNEGEIIFDISDKSDELYILLSGSCSILYIEEDGSESHVFTIISGNAIAGIVDVIAWLLGSPVTRKMRVRCLEACELLIMPTPSRRKDFSPSNTESFGKMLRSLLFKLNRTTIMTAFFYLGLADYIIPKIHSVVIPDELVQFLQGKSDNHIIRLNDCDDELKELVYETVAHVFLIRPEELRLLIPDPVRVERQESANPSMTCAYINPPKLKRSRSLNSQSPALLQDLKIPNDDTSYHNKTNKNIDDLPTLICMKCGQCLLDIDPIPGLYVIVTGAVQIIHTAGGQGDLNPSIQSTVLEILEKKKKTSTILGSGSLIGQISFIAGSSEDWYGRKSDKNISLLSAVARTKSWLIRIPTSFQEKILRAKPEIFLALGEKLICNMPPIIRIFDICSTWVVKDVGEHLIRAGDTVSASLFVLIRGKLLKVSDDNAENGANRSSQNQWTPQVLGKGALVGGAEALSGAPFQYSVLAIRSCTVACIPQQILSFIISKHPSVLTHLSKNVQDRSHWTRGKFGHQQLSKSIAIIPITTSVPLDLFCSILNTNIHQQGQTVKLMSSSIVSSEFGEKLYGLSTEEVTCSIESWMQTAETESNVVLYQCNWQRQHSLWNQLCIAQADEILFVGNALDSPQLSMAEIELENMIRLLPKTLVLLHINASAGYKPVGTRQWIESRTGITRHIHVRLNPNKLLVDINNRHSDMARLSRILCNAAVGLVLGGGGARGVCHLGVLQALKEADIPIDFIGGTSIGAFVAALYASDDQHETTESAVEQWAKEMGSLWSYFKDLTLPVTSYFNGQTFSTALRRRLGMQKIEDFWLGYFCVTTDLTSYRERIHFNGTAWRYVRASMSLANFLPPVCDVDKCREPPICHYLVDGGYVNNLPADVMKHSLHANTVFSVDVSGTWDIDADHVYEDGTLSGLFVLLSSLNPFGKRQKVPSMAQISTQLAYVSASRQLESAKKISDLYLRPPVDKYSIFDFTSFGEIRQTGYQYAKEQIQFWKQAETLQTTSAVPAVITTSRFVQI